MAILKSALFIGYRIVSSFISLYSLGLFYVYLSSRILGHFNI